MDPSEVSILGQVHKESAESSLASKKSDHSPKASSKKKSSSSKPRSDELKDLDEKWAERFTKLEAMLVSKTFAVPVEPVMDPLHWLPVISPF